MPRTRIGLGRLGLNQRRVDGQRHVVGERGPAGRELHLPLDAEVAPVDHGLELEARTYSAGPWTRLGPGAGHDDRACDPGHRELAVDADGAVFGELDLRGA